MAERAGGAVWAVVLSWDGLEDTRVCLRALASQTRRPDRILVVDNGSQEPVAPALQDEFPQATVRRNRENVGYAAGVNQGLAEALAGGAEYVLTPNNDAVLVPDGLERLLAALAAEPRAAAVSPKIVLTDAPDRIYYRGGRFSRVAGKPLHDGYRRRDPEPAAAAPFETEFFNACCPLYRAEALREVGGFDETYFAYYEDADWSRRARRAGWTLWVAPAARAAHADALAFRRHAAPGSGLTTPRKWFLTTRNQLWFLRRHGRAWRRWLGGAYWTLSRLGIAALLAGRGRVAKAQGVLNGLREGLGRLPAPRIPAWPGKGTA